MRSYPFRLKQRTLKSGRISYRGIYDSNPSKTYSSGKESYDEAVAWAYQQIDNVRCDQVVPTFGEFAKDFFVPGLCRWTERRLNHGTTFGQGYLPQRRGMLLKHLMPSLEKWRINAITAELLDNTLMSSEKHPGSPLAPQTVERLRTILRIILGEAKFRGLIITNPAEDVPPFYGTRNPTRPFTIEEIRKLFPEDIDQGMRIWVTLDWYGYFLMQWVGGVRPAEAAAFALEDWIKELHGAVLTHAMEAVTRIRKGLKTENNGVMAKPIVFNDQMEMLLTMAEYEGRDRKTPLFQVNRRTIELNAGNKHLALAARNAKVDLDGRTQYSLRHTFYTEMLKRLPQKDVEKMAGHRRLRKEYDHRQGVDFLHEAAGLRDVINDL